MVIGLFQCKQLNHSHAVHVNINILRLTLVLVFLLCVFFVLLKSIQQYWTTEQYRMRLTISPLQRERSGSVLALQRKIYRDLSQFPPFST